jgi:hypothetical protein
MFSIGISSGVNILMVKKIVKHSHILVVKLVAKDYATLAS